LADNNKTPVESPAYQADSAAWSAQKSHSPNGSSAPTSGSSRSAV